MPATKLLSAIVLSALALAAPAVAEIYKTVDKDGKVIYSDRPSDGAQPVEVKPTNRMSETVPPVPTPPGEVAPPERPYTSASIIEPGDGATISDPIGNVTVRYKLEPQRRPTDAVRLLLDMKPTGIPTADGIMVQNMERGDHRLQIQVVDPNGRVLAQSGTVNVLVVRPGAGARRASTPGPTPH